MSHPASPSLSIAISGKGVKLPAVIDTVGDFDQVLDLLWSGCFEIK
jgi:hypothetical protein